MMGQKNMELTKNDVKLLQKLVIVLIVVQCFMFNEMRQRRIGIVELENHVKKSDDIALHRDCEILWLTDDLWLSDSMGCKKFKRGKK
jgi:hypothetical protein